MSYASVNVDDFCETRKMLLGTQNQNHANIAASKGGTDFSIAAIMARGSSSREPSERSLSEFKLIKLYVLSKIYE